MSKHSKHNRHNQNKHKAQTHSPGQEAQAKAKADKQEQKAKDKEDMSKAGLTLTTDSRTGQVTAKDSKGQPALTKDDKAKLTKVKQAQAKATEARRLALEAQRQAKEALDELTVNGSGLVKTMVKELEAKVSEAQAKVTAIDAEIDALKTKRAEALVPLNDLLTEYKGLTGLDKATKAKGGKGTSGKAKSKANGNGRFTATVKAQGDHIKVLVTHIESKNLFETSLATTNGTVKADDWLALRHRFIAHYETTKAKAKADQALPAKDYNLILRAYLSNLKGKIEAVKSIV